jgi:drug/metabolite transporter (DMT)-like permease
MGFSSSRAAALLALVAGAAAIAFSPIFVRLTETGPAAAGFWRLAIALPALALLARQSRTPGRGASGPSPMTLIAGLFFALDLGFWHYGIKFTTVANSTILANLSPAFVTLGAWLLLGERPGWRFVAGLALAFVGVWIIAATKGGGAGLNPRLGDALSVTTSVWYAGYLLAVRKARAVESASQVMFWSSAAGAPLVLAAAFALHEQILPTSAGGWMACVGLGAVHVAGQGLIAWALGRLPAATASVVVLVQPVLSALLGWVIFAEPMAPLQVLGGAVALSGVVLAQLAAARAARQTPAQVSAS